MAWARALKRRVSDAIYAQLLADSRRPAAPPTHLTPKEELVMYLSDAPRSTARPCTRTAALRGAVINFGRVCDRACRWLLSGPSMSPRSIATAVKGHSHARLPDRMS